MSEIRSDLADGGGEPQPAPGTPGSTSSTLGAAPPSAAPPLTISIRQGVVDDAAFIFSTWLRSYAGSSYFARKIPRKTFFAYHHQIIERIIARNATVLVATPEDDPSTILGYLVHEGPVLHYIYTKGPFRRLGIASRLIKESGLDLNKSQFTHWTYDADDLLPLWPGLSYNPYLI